MEKQTKTSTQKNGKIVYVVTATSSPLANTGLKEKVKKLIIRDLTQSAKS